MLRRQFLSLFPAVSSRPSRPLGANTAIQGYGLFQAIELIRRLDLPVIEIHPKGRPQPTPNTYPGFRFNDLSPEERRQLRDALQPVAPMRTEKPRVEEPQGREYESGDQGRSNL